MKTFAKMSLLAALMAFGMVGCSKPCEGEGCGNNTQQSCGDCPTGTSCNPKTVKCEALCAKDADCGKCATCEDSFCNKFADFCVISIDPANGETDVAVSNRDIKIVFSDDVAPSTVETNRFSLVNADGGNVTIRTLEHNGAVVTMKYDLMLKSGSEYTINIAQEGMSVNNSYLPEPYQSKFTTIGSSSEVAGPAGYGLSPVAGQMKSSDGKYTLDVVGGPVAGTAENGGKSVTVSDGFWK